jgi:hypothetical protein
MELDTMQTAPTGTNGYGEKVPELTDLTERMKLVTSAMALADRAAEDVQVAIEKTRDVSVSGYDVDAYIVGVLGAELAKIGYEITKPRATRARTPKAPAKARGAKA